MSGALIAFDADYGLSFLRGMFATVNPCGFVLLPTYLIYFLGLDATSASTSTSGDGVERASIRRALLVGTAVASGFMVVFITIGLIGGAVHTWLVDQSLYVTLVVGIAFIVLGTAILAGWRPPFITPHVDVTVRSRTVTSMFVYGLAYGVASLGCTIAVFLPVISSPRGGFATNVANVAMFSAGIGLVVVALTVSLALANRVLVRLLRRVMAYVDLLAAAFMVLSGLYLVWYFFVGDVTGTSVSADDPVTGAVRRWEARIRNNLNDHWQLIAVSLLAVVTAAVFYVAVWRPRTTASASANDQGSDRDHRLERH